MNKPWIDPSFWERVRVGTCTTCGEGHVLKDGLCWNCRPERNPCMILFTILPGNIPLRCERAARDDTGRANDVLGKRAARQSLDS